jgi:RimJ/RimL family protein N-acetyltransferase
VIFPPGLPLVHHPDLNDTLAAWALDRTPHMAGADFGPCWCVGVMRGADLAAVVVYNNWEPAHGVVHMSIASASPRWASRQVIAALLGFPFVAPLAPGAQVCRKVVAVCASDNDRARQFVTRLGFTQEAVLASHFAHKIHAVVHRMFARDYARKYGGLRG